MLTTRENASYHGVRIGGGGRGWLSPSDVISDAIRVVFDISDGDVVPGVLAGFSMHKYASRRVEHVGMGLQPRSTIRVMSGRDCGGTE
jgi:hypothetical protein